MRLFQTTLFAAAAVYAQTAKPPTAYTVTQVSSMMVQGAVTTVYRDGSKAVVDSSHPPVQPGAAASHTRAFYDLAAGKSITWSPDRASIPCGAGRFSGSWGDPFEASAEMMADIAKQQPKETGTDTVAGLPAKVLETAQGPMKAKVWVDSKYGLVLKAVITGPDGKPQTLLEVQKAGFTPPPAAAFALPPSCKDAAAALLMPTEGERIAAETGGKAGAYADALMPPASPNSCTVLFKVVRAGTLQPVAGGYQVAIDRSVNLDHLASYSTGMSANGHATFSGGSIKEVTGEMRNGVLRIENAPAQLEMDVVFGKGGDSSALIYRHCFKPETTLMLVVKNPEKLSDGADWLWVK